ARVNGDGIARHTDDALDEILAGVPRKLEDNDIAAAGLAKEVLRLVHEDIFVVLERRLHAGTVNTVVLHHQMDSDEQEQGEDRDLQHLAQEPCAALLTLLILIGIVSLPTDHSLAGHPHLLHTPSSRAWQHMRA